MMTEEEYEKTLIRIFDSVRGKSSPDMGSSNCGSVECSDCPFDALCSQPRMHVAYSIVEIVEKWAKEHPIKTNLDVFKETFPDFKWDTRLITECGVKSTCTHYQTAHDCTGCNNFITDWFNQEYKGDNA